MNGPFPFTFIVALSGAFLPAIATSQSLRRDEISRSVLADKRASRIGDIVTIAVQEDTAATKDNNPQTSKEPPMDASVFRGSPLCLLLCC